MTTIYRPSANFITVSLTGDACALQCPHCQGRFLKHMAPAITPQALYDLAEESAKKGVKGMLISGGCDVTGQVPVFNYLDIIKNIKKNIDIKINLHTGFIHLDNISRLAGKGIDLISFDVIGSPDVVKRIYGLNLGPDYFDKAFGAFTSAGLKVIPHITAGLDRGLDSGEEDALRIMARHAPGFVVINALMSSEGSENSMARMLEVLRMARDILPKTTKIVLGCMRPRGDIIDAALVRELGIVSVAMAPKGLIAGLRRMGVKIDEADGCCCFHDASN